MARFEMNDSRAHFLYAAIAFTVALVVYLVTLCPSVYVGDSGEFITNASILGINHPTGYTVYTLLSRLIIMITPFWTAAYAVNFFSALCAALAVACLYYLLTLFIARRGIALAFSLVFSFSYTFWSRATTAEVYALNAFFVALAIFLAVRWYFSQSTRDLVILAYVVGFGLSQHVLGALVAPSIVLLLVLKQPRLIFNFKLVLLLFGVAVVGFSAYLYLPLRSLADPPIDWGNPETVQRVVGHFLPKSGERLFGEISEGYYSSRLVWIVQQVFTKEFWYLGGLSVFGLFVLRSRHWRLLVFLLSIAGINAWFTVVRKLPLHADFDAYFIPSYFVMTVLLALSANWAWDYLSSRWSSANSTFSTMLFTTIVFAIPALLLKLNYYENDRSNNWFGYDFGKNMLSTVPKNAILFSTGDEQTFSAWYFKYVEKERDDITVVDRNLIGAIWGGSHMYNRELNLQISERETPVAISRQIVSSMIGKRPLYCSPRLQFPFMVEEYDVWHHGMSIELAPKGSPLKPYQPTEFSLHPGWDNQFFDERCKLIVKFYYKEYLDNAKFWYTKGNTEAALNEIELFHAFPYPQKDAEDIRTVFLLYAQIHAERKEFDGAMAATDSAKAHGVTDYRVHEMKGNISFMMKDTAAAIQNWRTALAYNPNNEKLKKNIEILTRPKQTPTRVVPPRDRRRTRPQPNIPFRRNQ